MQLVVVVVVLVAIESTKTHYITTPPVVFRLPACCPVSAWKKYIGTMNLIPNSVALMLLNGVPLSAKTLLRTLKLVSFELFGVDRNFTLQSL